VDPFNNVLFSSSFNSDQGTLTLSPAGTYFIIIEGRRDSGTGTANYTFNVAVQGNQPPPPLTGTPLAIGDLVSAAIGVPGEIDAYVFTLPAAARLYFDSMTDTGSIFWTLVGPAGTHVSNRGFNNSDSFDVSNPVLNLASGDYRLTVAGSSGSTGTYSFRLMDFTTAAPLTPGSPVSSSLSLATESDLYQFNVVAGDQFYFDVTTAVSNALWRLIDPFNNVVFSSGFGSDVDTQILTRPGTYTLLIEGRFNAGSGASSYVFTVNPVGLPTVVPGDCGECR
jgi:hypothetical protein